MPDEARDLDVELLLDAWAAARCSAAVSPELVQRVRDALAPSLTPVEPLPSQRALVLAFLAVFVAGASGLVALVSKVGFHLMTPVQIGGICAILAGAGALFACKLAAQIIPGSRPGIPVWGLLTLAGVAIFGALGLLFPWHTSNDFVSGGWPCALMELLAAVPATAVLWLLARRGAPFVSAGTSATLSGLGGLLALIPVQFQCVFPQAPHLLVWHGGTALVWVGSAALIWNFQRGRWNP